MSLLVFMTRAMIEVDHFFFSGYSTLEVNISPKNEFGEKEKSCQEDRVIKFPGLATRRKLCIFFFKTYFRRFGG